MKVTTHKGMKVEATENIETESNHWCQAMEGTQTIWILKAAGGVMTSYKGMKVETTENISH